MPLLAALVLHATGTAVKTLIDRGLGSLSAGGGECSEGRNRGSRFRCTDTDIRSRAVDLEEPSREARVLTLLSFTLTRERT
jgi:hypothetical protein